MSKSDAFENSLLLLIFNNTNIANIGDATGLRGSTTAGSLYVSLHTADPGEAGTQSTSEISYTGYARQAVARASGAGGWTVTGNSVSPASAISFGAMTAGAGGTATNVGVGTAVSGAGVLIYKGALSPTIAVSNGVTPQITTSSTITED
jgi:hypothetical protein